MPIEERFSPGRRLPPSASARRIAPEHAPLRRALRDIPPEIRDSVSGGDQGPRETLQEVAKWLDVCPPWGSTFDRGAEIDVAAGILGSEIISFSVSPGEIGVLRGVGNQAGTLADLEYITFTLLRDGAGIPGYVAWCGMKGDGAERLDELVVPLMPGQTISVVVNNNSGIALKHLAARIKGWVWNPSMEPRS